ncbi:hypothetical protein BH09BAC5_BH09BAC5_28370 [soil metagenome]
MKKLLIVDDDPIVLKMIEVHLSFEGFDILTAFDGFDALEKIERNKFDLIISDIMMQELSGLTLLSITRKFHGEIPIIFISSMDSNEDISRYLGLGADDFFIKPINLDRLSLRIQQLLEQVESDETKINKEIRS